MTRNILKRFDLSGKTAAVTGGGGELCGAMAQALGAMGVMVPVLDISLEKAEARARAVVKAGGVAEAFRCDVLDADQIRKCYEAVCSLWGPPDLLINGAGGNDPRGSTSAELHEPEKPLGPGAKSFFDLDPAGFRQVFDLNFLGTFLVTQAFSKAMVAKRQLPIAAEPRPGRPRRGRAGEQLRQLPLDRERRPGGRRLRRLRRPVRQLRFQRSTPISSTPTSTGWETPVTSTTTTTA